MGVCEKCGTPIPPSNAFCGSCGASAAGATIAPLNRENAKLSKQVAANLPGRPYTARFAVLAITWVVMGILALPILTICVIFHSNDNNDPLLSIGAIALLIFGVVLYTLPSVLACLSVHPSRYGVYFVNWLLGWTVFGWIGAMIWALSGINGRAESLKKFSTDDPVLITTVL